MSIGNAYTAEVMANLGFDWLCVDLQHGLIDYQDLTAMLPAISTTETTPIVRVPWNEPYEIMKALDAGAYGVIVPMVNNREEALRAVSACRYPPVGLRSFGPIRAALYGGRGYSVESNGEIACIVMIETAEALENLQDIVTTPGVDGVYIGPSDLALALGLPAIGDNNHPNTRRGRRAYPRRVCRAPASPSVSTRRASSTRSRYLSSGFQFARSVATAASCRARQRKICVRCAPSAKRDVEKTGY